MTLNVNSLLCRQRYVYCDKRVVLGLRSFRYKVPLYLRYLQITFDDEIKGNSFKFQAYSRIDLRAKLNWRLG